MFYIKPDQHRVIDIIKSVENSTIKKILSSGNVVPKKRLTHDYGYFYYW